jgi:hypothetical protein
MNKLEFMLKMDSALDPFEELPDTNDTRLSILDTARETLFEILKVEGLVK